MAQNFPGPYELRIFYNATFASITYSHVARLSLDIASPPDVGEDFLTIIPIHRDGSVLKDLDEVKDDLITVLQPLFHTSTNFVNAELWKYETDTFDSSFVSVSTIGLVGTSSTATAADAQTIWTLRTTNGGIGKLDLRHTIAAQGVYLDYPTGSAIVDDVFDYLSAADSVFIARDDGWLAAPFKYLPGVNERMTRRRLR